MNFYYGVVENRADPLQLGRCQVRVVGLHTHDKSLLPTADLPWATPIQSVTSAAMNGIGYTPVGPVEGTSVVVMFADDDYQQAIILGTVGGISTQPGTVDLDEGEDPLVPTDITKIELLTVAGPTNGNQLTFVDKKYGRTDLTSKLSANMKVYGFDIKEETTIVSVDSGTQITISSSVENYGENLITFKEAPTNLDAVTQSKAQSTLTDGSGNPVTDGSGTPIKTGDSPVQSSKVNDSIPTIPPPKSVPNASKASDGIKALLAACDKVGLTTKEQKCALLGIAGGESAWVPQLESYQYSPSRLKEVFSFATPSDIEKYSNAAKKGMSREEFFSWVYGPTTRGKNFLGNKTDADGGKYFGRGFIGLTGRENYTKFQKWAKEYGVNLNLVDDPDSLDADLNTSAIVAALYLKKLVPSSVNPSSHPGYFEAAKKAVGVNVPNIAARKRQFYEYFYGNSSYGGVDKDAAPPAAEPPKDDNYTGPGPSADSVKTGSDSIGFRDPNNKYPLKSYLNEVDTNRLARGIIEGTIIERKDASVVTGVPKALGQGKWDQPQACFGAQYPFNKVFETESGHVQEFDDTPGQERIHTYHRSGTFSEIDPQGTQVNYIVGDNFVIMERNGCIRVAGECNITVEGNTNIFARSDANIEVTGNADVQVKNNLNIGVATDTTLSVGGDFKVKVGGDFTVDAGNAYIKSQADLDIQASGGLSAKGSTVNVEAEGEANYLSGGTTSMDYSQGQFGNGAAGANDVESLDLTPPDLESPSYPSVPFLIPPERKFEEKAVIETEEELNTPEGRAQIAKQQRQDGVEGGGAATVEESSKPTGGTNNVVPAECKVIYATKNFSNDFRISKNFTLGMLIDGGVNGKHKLVDQMLTDSATGQARLFTVQEIVCNLANATENILEPLLGVLPGGIGGYKTQWQINSGYRMKGAVKAESATSDHPKGLAFDVGIIHPNNIQKTYELCQASEKIVPYNQIILEYAYPKSVWMHVSYKAQNRQKWAFTMVNHHVYQRDSKGIPSGFVLLNTIPAPSK